MMKDQTERLRNLIRLYRKYRDAGQTIQAARTLTRIREVGGVEAQTLAVSE